MKLITKEGLVAVAAINLTVGAVAVGAREWHYDYNADGLLLSADGPRQDVVDVTRYDYDSAGNRTSVTNALGHRSYMLDHDDRGLAQRLVDVNGVETVVSYNSRGWILSSTVLHPTDSSQDATTRYRYDSVGQLLTVTLPDGSLINNEYDAAQRLIAVTNGRGDRTDYTLDDSGNKVAEVTRDNAGSLRRSRARTYDELSRLIGITGAAGQSMSYAFDRNGNKVSYTDGRAFTTYQTYDALDRLAGKLAPLSHSVHYDIDERDNWRAITDPGDLVTRAGHDGVDNLTHLDSPDSGRTTFTYDEAGNRRSRTDANGVVTDFSYDALNRLIGITYPNEALNVSYGYDVGDFGKGRLTSMSDASGETSLVYDHRGNVVEQRLDTGTHLLGLAYSYDVANRLTAITYPSGRVVTYTRDSNGQVSSVSSAMAGEVQMLASNIDYLPFGPMSRMDYGNGLEYIADFDLDYRIARSSHGAARDVTYAYDDADNIITISDALDPTNSQRYTYDALSRLVAAEGGYGTLGYSYDSNGNRLSYSTSEGVTNYVYDIASHRLMQTAQHDYQYDDNGNMVVKLSRSGDNGDGVLYRYDDNNRLTQVVQRTTSSGDQSDAVLATYTYNALGQRAKKQRSDGAVNYLYGRDGSLLAEVRSDGLVLREYIYLNGQPLAVAYTAETQSPPTPGPEIVLDDGDPETSSTGSWEYVRKKGALNDYYRRSDTNGFTYRWQPANLNAAEYEVWAWWPRTKKNNASARYRIAHNGQSSFSPADQSHSGRRWTLLGTFQFDGSGSEYIEISDEGGKTAADGIRLVELVRPQAEVTTNLYYFHNDHLGTPQVMTDGSQAVVWRGRYKPFGEVDISVSTIENNLRFPGQYFDKETGLHHNYFRDYDPTLGRYLQGDPLGMLGKNVEPPIAVSESSGIRLETSLVGVGDVNLYSYAMQNPVTNVDEFGLKCHVQASTGTRVCDTPQELGFSRNFSSNGDNSAFPASMNDANVKTCIKRNLTKCNTVPTSPGKPCDVRAAAVQATACSIVVVTKCTATGGN